MKKFKNNISGIFTLALLISFLSSTISLCDIITESCKVDTESCCCKKSSETSEAQLMKKCCCEIKENTAQPAGITLITFDSKPVIKVIVTQLNSFSDSFTDNVSVNSINTFHTPPGGDICIINSNLRI